MTSNFIEILRAYIEMLSRASFHPLEIDSAREFVANSFSKFVEYEIKCNDDLTRKITFDIRKIINSKIHPCDYAKFTSIEAFEEILRRETTWCVLRRNFVIESPEDGFKGKSIYFAVLVHRFQPEDIELYDSMLIVTADDKKSAIQQAMNF